MATEKFFSAFLDKLDSLERLSDKYWGKQQRAEVNGDIANAERMDHKMDCINAEMNGMLTTLHLLGYVLQYQNGRPVIVEA